MPGPYSLDKIKTAFWETFNGAGELWLPPEEPGEFSNVNYQWEEFLEKLEKTEGTT